MVNEVILIGNVGKDPEIHAFDSGSKVAKFSLATTKNYKNKSGEKVADTSWHNIVIWGKLADIVEQFVKKGSKLYLKGEIQYGSYDDKDGNKKYTTDINCFNMQMLDSKPTSAESEQVDKITPGQNTGLPIEEDDPFGDVPIGDIPPE